MPQLDNNTFLHQYTVLIIIFLIIYLVLGFIVLPLNLRSLIFKLKILTAPVFHSISSDSPTWKIYSALKSIKNRISTVFFFVRGATNFMCIKKFNNSEALSNNSGIIFNRYTTLVLLVATIFIKQK